jgi:sterol desaturase/sphingolipid hydroxylase (fatty acid hydroxylase superfamily)
MWARWLNVILGFWLVSSPFVLDYRLQVAQLNELVVGLGILIVGLLAMAVRKLRYVNTALSAWLIVSPFLLGYSSYRHATVNAIVVGLLVFALSLVWDHRDWSPHRRTVEGT